MIIPCFRVTRTIAGALDSIETQRLPSDVAIEVILVVDGLKADADAIAGLFDARATPYRFAATLAILRRNLGAGMARSHGWALCSGELVAMLDDDDVWYPDKLALQLALHRSYPEQIASGHQYGSRPPGLAGILPRIMHAGRPQPVSLRQLLWRPRFIPTTVMIRRAAWPRGPERFRNGEDMLMNFMIAAHQPMLGLAIDLAGRSPHAPPAHADRDSLSRRRLRSRLSQMRNYVLLVWRGQLNPLVLPPLLVWSIALGLRRYLLDGAEFIGRILARNWARPDA
ncbi:glycosyltransferase family 2 protein [Novosphingobium sp. TH158]|uniref:glycosyltransferase family 2 protein n=1 Tax=Novosphingobium sp. TH158 TaxID=2067455 RepID=UPI0020B14196|nr:glycosyltransferase family 2 protein [Novosphingobium sp. TH158]